jgi:hypothetical protein
MGSLPLVQEELDNGTLVIPFPGIDSDPKFYHLIYAATSTLKPEIEAFSRWLLTAATAPPPCSIDMGADPGAGRERQAGRRTARRAAPGTTRRAPGGE